MKNQRGEMSAANLNHFNSLSSKIGNLLYVRTEKDRQNLHKTLDELISITCRYPVVINPKNKAILLVNQCCSHIPSDDAVLVQKCSELIRNLIHNQNITIEGKTLTLAVKWCMSGLQTSSTVVLLDILKALEALLRCDVKNLKLLFGNIIKDLRSLVVFQDRKYPEINLLILECLEACTTPIREIEYENNEQLEICAQIFLEKLYEKHNHDDFISVKTLQICLFGLQNVVIQHPDFLKCDLGNLLGIIKAFMLYGVKDVDFLEPSKVLPSTLSVPEPTAYTREKKQGKLTKLRKQKSSGVHKKKERQSEDTIVVGNNRNGGYTPANTGLAENAGEKSTRIENRLGKSDSDLSDNESGRNSKISRMQGRVRQATHNLFYDVVKKIDKSIFFSYWSSFIPDDLRSGQHNLITCILKDSLAESRMAALNVLHLLLTSSKPFLIQAESSDKSTSFTPFSVVLGLTLNELHRGLCMALNEKVALVLTQVLKCFAALVQATPYHRMFPGLITKVVQNVKPILYNNKVASVQVTALIVLGCIVAFEPVMPEIVESMSRIYPTANIQKDDEKEPTRDDTDSDSEDIDDVEFVFDEEDTNSSTMPWLIQKCLDILVLRPGVEPDNEKAATTPVPVKLESLQVISAMSASYFENLIAPYLGCVTRALKVNLREKQADLRLHTGRTVDFIGQAIERYFTNRDPNIVLSFEDHLSFWQTLLDGPIVELIQCEEDPILRAVGCDCLGSIGTDIFEKLPRDKQILCVTLLLSRSRDNENNVKGAAVRSLGMCVHYSPLKDDPGFVVDATEAICSTIKIDNVIVRIKTSWALGNLSDSLVLNRKLIEESEEISEDFFLKILETSISALSYNEKVKMNVVRAIGNLIYLFTGEMLEKSKVVEASERAFEALVKCCTTNANMKVRWNACHGIGNALKNPNIYNKPNNNWQKLVFDALAELVVGFRNFKVRINAASALASPTARDHYGRFYFPVWTTLLKGLETCQNIGDFTEYKHRDNLIEQLCLSLGHLTTLLLEEDLLQLQDTIYLYFEIFKYHTHKVSERLVPEKLTSLASASYNLIRLGKSTSLTEGQKSVLNCLTVIFAPLS